MATPSGVHNLILRIRTKRVFNSKGVAYLYCMGSHGSGREDQQLHVRFDDESNVKTEGGDADAKSFQVPPVVGSLRAGDVILIKKAVPVYSSGAGRALTPNNTVDSRYKDDLVVDVADITLLESWVGAFQNTLVKDRSKNGPKNPQHECLMFHPPVLEFHKKRKGWETKGNQANRKNSAISADGSEMELSRHVKNAKADPVEVQDMEVEKEAEGSSEAEDNGVSTMLSPNASRLAAAKSAGFPSASTSGLAEEIASQPNVRSDIDRLRVAVNGSDKKLNPLPIALVQCSSARAMRLKEFFGGRTEIASSLIKDRVLYIFEENQVFKRLFPAAKSSDSPSLPGFLHGIIRRVYYITERPVVSMEECIEILQPNVDLTEVPRSIAFPRELESTIYARRQIAFEKIQAEKQSAVSAVTLRSSSSSSSSATAPNDTATLSTSALPSVDSIVYADGYYWIGQQVPRIIVPEKVQTEVPSGAYWKLMEINARYECSDGRSVVEKYGRVSKVDASREPEHPEKKRRTSSNDSQNLKTDPATNRDLLGDTEPLTTHMAIDIGASPGGWSYCLAKELGIQRVFAPAEHMAVMVKEVIDERKVLEEDDSEKKRDSEGKEVEKKSEMKSEKKTEKKSEKKLSTDNVHDFELHNLKPAKLPVRTTTLAGRNTAGSTPKISHYQMGGAEAIEILTSEELRKMRVYVCDMNDKPEVATGLFERFLERRRDAFKAAAEALKAATQKKTGSSRSASPTDSVSVPPLLMALTFKNVQKGSFDARKEVLLKKLSEKMGVENLREIHLFANKKETTVVGEVMDE